VFEAFAVESIRAAERAAMDVVGDDALMRRAAAALAGVIAGELRDRRPDGVAGARVVLLIGPGNNGGDALFAGAQLARDGATVTAWRAGDAVHEAGWAKLIADGGGELAGDVAAVAGAVQASDLVVDGLLGIGGKPGLRGVMADLARAIGPAPRALIVAVDLPSGIAVEAPFAALTGNDAVPHLAADLTVTFGGAKPCHVLEPGRSACGRLVRIDIGLPPMSPALRCWEPADVAAVWPLPNAASDKYSRGVVGLDVGSARYPGAAVLATLGALSSGAGFIRYRGAVEARPVLLARAPSITFGDGPVQAWVLGCGWDDTEFGPARLAARLADGVPCVLDAGTLPLLADLTEPLPHDCLLTPHAGELARLLGVPRATVVADPVAHARGAADRFGAAVLLKGATQVVATPGDDAADVAVPGPAWTAQAGSGDVLAGIAGTLLAAGLPARNAGVAAASVQALAAARHPGPYPPDALATRLPRVIARLAGGAGLLSTRR